MSTKKPLASGDAEIAAISLVYDALQTLDALAQARVLDYVARKLGLTTTGVVQLPQESREKSQESGAASQLDEHRKSDSESSQPDECEGISPPGIKWIKRNGISSKSLSDLYSLGVDEIDLIAQSVPGKNMKERMRSVILMKGIASYLGTGAPRVTHQQGKEACLHYKAFDATNFATHMKALASDISGNKEGGYTLTARGLSSATDLIKSALESKT